MAKTIITLVVVTVAGLAVGACAGIPQPTPYRFPSGYGGGGGGNGG